MTTKKIILIVCNGCGATALPPGLAIIDATHLEHPVDSVVDARALAHRKGWVHDKLGRDMCPNCRTFPAPKRAHKALHPGRWRSGA